jgi:nitric oxide reductase NorE protein
MTTESTVRAHMPTPQPRIPGEAGIWVFVLGDMTVFASFFATFMYSRGTDPDGFARDHAALEVVLGTLNTALLVTSSLFVVVAVQRMLAGTQRTVPSLIAAALACGVGFTTVKVFEWSELFGAGAAVGSSEFFSYYFMFTGIHLLHVHRDPFGARVGRVRHLGAAVSRRTSSSAVRA